MTADTVIRFWFEEIDRKLWYRKDPAFDRLLETRFSDLHRQASAGELYPWRDTAEGALAEIIILDQFSRNLFRDSPRAFAQDGQALVLAQYAVQRGLDRSMAAERRAFLYMPYMHSESRLIHEQAVRLFSQPGLENSLEFEMRHKAIIDRFGRYPHRNAILDRQSTAEELEFLTRPGSSF